MFEKIGMSARAMPYKRRPNKRGKQQIQWKLTRCPKGQGSLHPTTCVDNEAGNKPLPMLLFSARDNCDMSFLQWVNALHTWRDGRREAGRAGGSGGVSVWVMPSVDVYENFLNRSQAVGTPMACRSCKAGAMVAVQYRAPHPKDRDTNNVRRTEKLCVNKMGQVERRLQTSMPIKHSKSARCRGA